MKYTLLILICFLIIGLFSCEIGSNNPNIHNPEGVPVLSCEDFNDDIKLEHTTGQDVDYIIDCLVEVNDEITVFIFDGAVIEFTSGSGLIFKDRSNLHISSPIDSDVILRGNESEPGYWKGIRMESDEPDNIIKNVEIYDAGSTTDSRFYGAITIAGGVNIIGSLISNSANYGVYYEDKIGIGNSFNTVEITNCQSYPVRIGFQKVGELAGKWPGTRSEEPVNKYSGNSPDRIQVISQSLSKSTTFRNQGIPFEISETLIADETVQIEDNVELVFKEDTRFIIKKQITAWDNGGDAIIMRSDKGVTAGWDGLYIQTGLNSEGRNKIINVHIKDGGGGGKMKANIAIESGVVNVKDCMIGNSASCGLKYIVPQTRLYEESNVYFDNAEGNICEINN